MRYSHGGYPRFQVPDLRPLGAVFPDSAGTRKRGFPSRNPDRGDWGPGLGISGSGPWSPARARCVAAKMGPAPRARALTRIGAPRTHNSGPGRICGRAAGLSVGAAGRGTCHDHGETAQLPLCPAHTRANWQRSFGILTRLYFNRAIGTVRVAAERQAAYVRVLVAAAQDRTDGRHPNTCNSASTAPSTRRARGCG
jgi:hypothetical protein